MFFGSAYLNYWLFLLPALILGLIAQARVRSAFNKYSRIMIRSGRTGEQIAREMLDRNGLYDVNIELRNGWLSDHYDPRAKTLRLSQAVYSGRTIAAAGIAAHECGHALQDSKQYLPLKIRSLMVPSVQIGSWLGPVLFGIGLFFDYMSRNSTFGLQIASIGLLLFAATAVFSIITLPVEFNATRRAKTWLKSSGLMVSGELEGVDRVLNAAAMTYVAAAIQAIMQVLYYATLLSRRRR